MPNASGDEVLPEHAIFRFELIGEFPQQLFYPAEDLGRQPGGENDAALDDSLLAQAFRLIGLDPAQGFKQCVGVLAQQGRTADRDG
jgi:hypothetical protein